MSTARFNTLSNAAGSKSVPVDTVVDGSAKAWVNFNGTGTVAIRASFNVSSITDNGTGDYTLNFTSALTDANYSVVGTSSGASGAGANRVVAEQPEALTPRSTTQVRVGVAVGGAATLVDSSFVNVAVFR